MGRLLFLFLMLTPPALAQDAIRLAAFYEGRFEEAASMASVPPTANSYAFSARALLAEGMCGDGQPAPELLDAAEANALAALELDDQHVESRLQLAIVLSLKTRPMTTSEAHKTGYATRARKLAEEMVEIEPGNSYAHGFLAVWNIEVVRRGGTVGSAVMGASVRDARRHYLVALASSPDDVILHWQYARALAALNARKYRDEIETALELAVSGEAGGTLEQVMAGRAEVLQQALQVQSRRDVQALAKSML